MATDGLIGMNSHKYGVVRQQHAWVKVHLMCGVKTNIVTAVEIREKDASDTKLLPDLVNTTAAHFDMREVSADKGYSSVKNHEVIAEHGATPYIAFKSIHSGAAGGLWEKMFHYFAFNRQEFMAHYHKRSNVESTFSMITHGSLIFRAVCENQDSASYRCHQGSQGAPECAVARARGASEATAAGGLRG
jgi:Transposase DDE domain